jgi:hypothetical protein
MRFPPPHVVLCPPFGSTAGVEKRKALEAEMARVRKLPCGTYTRHRIKVITKALEILGEEGVIPGEDAGKELEKLLKQLSL